MMERLFCERQWPITLDYAVFLSCLYFLDWRRDHVCPPSGWFFKHHYFHIINAPFILDNKTTVKDGLSVRPIVRHEGTEDFFPCRHFLWGDIFSEVTFHKVYQVCWIRDTRNTSFAVFSLPALSSLLAFWAHFSSASVDQNNAWRTNGRTFFWSRGSRLKALDASSSIREIRRNCSCIMYIRRL